MWRSLRRLLRLLLLRAPSAVIRRELQLFFKLALAL